MATEPSFFLIIGAMKAGTTSLYSYLAGHPDLYASPKKEPRVFRDPADSASLRVAFEALFKGRTNEAWCFEGSTAYTKHPGFPGVAARIYSVVPNARLVYLVRNPVERAWSQYLHSVAQGRESRSFERAIEEEPQYLDIGRYHLQLQQYLRLFPRERILVGVFEEMVKDPQSMVRAVCEFLGVDAAYRPADAHVAFNASSEKLAAPAPLRAVRKLGVHGQIPWRVRHWLKERGAPLPRREVELRPDLRARVVDAVTDDTEAFFQWLGRRITAWCDFA